MPFLSLSMMRQLVPFVLIGVACAVIDFGITYPLTEVVGVDRLLSKAVGWCFGTLAAYLLNSRFAFQAKVTAKRATAVFALYATTFAVQVGLYAILDAPLASLGFTNPLKDFVAFFIAQGVAAATNFALQRYVIFRSETQMAEQVTGQ